MKKLFIATLLLLTLKVPGKFPVEKLEHDDMLKDVMAVELSSSKAAILMDVATNEVLFEYNAHEKRAPASMTKIMTMKLVLDAINDDKFTYDEMLTTSDYASSMGGSQIYLSPNEQMKVKDLFKSMVIASANDATVVFAEKISGTEEDFAKLMNHTAIKLGCKNTNFSNATGLPTENHYTTCYDMALIACSLLKDYEEEVIPYSSLYESYVREDTDNPFWLVNTNKLLKANLGIDGLKTGWTNDAGYCITTTMKKGNMRLVCVVMGAENPTKRNQDAVKVLNYGFSNYILDEITEKGTIIEIDSDISLDPSKYHIVTSEPVYNLRYNGEKNADITQEVEIYRDKIRNLETKKIGVLKTYINGNLMYKTDLELVEQPKKASFINLLISIFKSIF